MRNKSARGALLDAYNTVGYIPTDNEIVRSQSAYQRGKYFGARTDDVEGVIALSRLGPAGQIKNKNVRAGKAQLLIGVPELCTSAL